MFVVCRCHCLITSICVGSFLEFSAPCLFFDIIFRFLNKINKEMKDAGWKNEPSAQTMKLGCFRST